MHTEKSQSDKVGPSPVLDKNNEPRRAAYKYEIRDLYGVGDTTWQKWCKAFEDDLRDAGVTSTTKLLTPNQIRVYLRNLG